MKFEIELTTRESGLAGFNVDSDSALYNAFKEHIIPLLGHYKAELEDGWVMEVIQIAITIAKSPSMNGAPEVIDNEI